MKVQLKHIGVIINFFVGIILLFNYDICDAQKRIEGKYYIEGMGYSANSITFFKDGTFEDISSGCIGVSEYGKGHYSLTKDSLILNYDLTELTEDTYHRWKKYDNLEDSIQIRVKLITPDIESIVDMGLGSSQDRAGVIFNKEGNAVLRLKKEMKHKTIFISNLEYGNYNIPIYGLYSYDINVYLKPLSEYRDAIKIRSTKPIKYKILKRKKDYFILEDEEGKRVTFRKKKSE